MDNLDFSEEEIQEQLAILGYKNIPRHRLREFKRDLDELIRHGEWKTLASSTEMNSTKTHPAASRPSPPAYTKEKVSRPCFRGSGEGFFLHAANTDHERQVLTTCQNTDYAWQQGRCDSYAQHSVAPKLQLPPGAPTRLQVESDPEDTLHPLLTDSYTSSPDTQGRRFIKRKVLRKHKGQSLVCDESIYSEDSDHTRHTPQQVQVATMYKMYNTQWDEGSDDDKNSLSSSFWSDGEKQQEEEEEVEIERVVTEEDSKPAAEAQDSVQEASEAEKPELKNQGNSTGESLEDGSNDDDEEEEEEEEEEEVERVVDKAEESNQETSEEDKSVLNNQRSSTGESMEDGSNDDEEEEAEEEEEGEDEEEVEIERVVSEEDSKPVAKAKDSEEEKPELKNQRNSTGESSEERNKEEEEENCSNSSSSPAPSLMTSGYGTYRPEEQEGGDYRDDHTITEFDQDSRGDLSETRDDEDDDHSLCSFGGFDVESTQEPDYSEDNKPEADVAEVQPEEDKDRADEEKSEDLRVKEQEEEQQHHTAVKEDRFLSDDGSDPEERKQAEDKGESESPDGSSSNKDIKFIDSKVDFSWTAYDRMCEEWEGNLRQMKDAASCLEERLAELHLSTSAQHDNLETENDDETSQTDDTHSSDADRISLSAFESYIRGMTRTRSDGDLRPKPKSFIRPVMRQHTVKKSDPVAKYFQYKQLWEMFKLPGEKDRRALRWEIKERLAYQPPPPKPRRVYVPNTYIVPTEKKRSALRWEIRNDLANGLLPHNYNYRF